MKSLIEGETMILEAEIETKETIFNVKKEMSPIEKIDTGEVPTKIGLLRKIGSEKDKGL